MRLKINGLVWKAIKNWITTQKFQKASIFLIILGIFFGTLHSSEAASTLLLGHTDLEANQDYNAAGIAEAFQFSALATGKVNKLYVYIEASSSISQLVAGIYSNSPGNDPESLLTQAALTDPGVGKWVGLEVPPVDIVQGSLYWIAVLSPSGRGALRFRDSTCCGKAQTSTSSTLEALPEAWTTGASYTNSPVSAYAVFEDVLGSTLSPAQTSTFTAGKNFSALKATRPANPTRTPAPTRTKAPTATDTATQTSQPSATLTSTPTEPPTPTQTASPTATQTPIATATQTPTSTESPTANHTPTPTATQTIEPYATFTPTLTATFTQSATATPLPSATATSIPTYTPTSTPASTATSLPTSAPTSQPSSTPTPTLPPTQTSTPTLAPTLTPTSAPAPAVYFPVGPGSVDVIPHQIVRANDDRLYLFAGSGVYGKSIKSYWMTNPGLPSSAASFTTGPQIVETSTVISVDTAYDGLNTIHVLVNLGSGTLKDYPFNLLTKTYRTPITIAPSSQNPASAATSVDIGTSGISSQFDRAGNLHLVYWSVGNAITHLMASYDPAANTLVQLTAPVAVDGGQKNANHPSIAVSPVDDSLTVSWVSGTNGAGKIFIRSRAADGSWNTAAQVNTADAWTSPNFGLNIDQGPSLLVDSTGVKHLVYIENWRVSAPYDYGRIHYVHSTASGWADEYIGSYTHDPALALDASGNLMIIGHGHPVNTSCTSIDDMCLFRRNPNGAWQAPSLFATPPAGLSFDGSPSVKWSVVGWNRPETIEFLFFATPYDSPTLYYGRP